MPKGNSDDALLTELVAIKKLLVYALMNNGASQKQIGAAIGVSQSSISRMFPETGAKKALKAGRSVSE